MKIKTFAVDLAKEVFQVHGFGPCGQRALKRRLKRAEFLRFFAQREARGVVVMEACRGAHHWARQLQELGYRAELIAPQHVKALVVGQARSADPTPSRVASQPGYGESGRRSAADHQPPISLPHLYPAGTVRPKGCAPGADRVKYHAQRQPESAVPSCNPNPKR